MGFILEELKENVRELEEEIKAELANESSSYHLQNVASLEDKKEKLEIIIQYLKNNNLAEVHNIIVNVESWEAAGTKVLPKKLIIPIEHYNLYLFDDLDGASHRLEKYVEQNYGGIMASYSVEVEGKAIESGKGVKIPARD